MSQALLALGIVAVSILLVALAIRIVVRRLLSGLGQSVEEMLQAVTLAPPVRIHLEPVSDPPWRDPEGFHAAAQSLADLGYAESGAYRIRETDLLVLGFACEHHSTYAALYEHPTGDLCIDVVTLYPSGALHTTSTGPRYDLPRPDDMPLNHLPSDTPADAIHAEHLRTRDSGEPSPVTPAEFPATVESAHTRALTHVAATGLSAESVRSIAEAAGIHVTDAVVDRTRRAFQMQAEIELLEELRHRFLDESGLTASEWEAMRDDVVFVHDRMTEDHVVGAYAEALDWEEDQDAERLELTAEAIARSAPPRDAFARLNESLPKSRAFLHIGQIEGPVRADVYRQRAA